MPDDFDALDYARQQLRILAQESDGTQMTSEFRLGLGLLAAQVATAERMSSPPPKPAPAGSIWGPAAADSAAEAPDPVTIVAPDGSAVVWDVELIGRILAASKPAGVEMIRAIADAGGRISRERFLEATGRRSIAGMTQAIRSATTTAISGTRMPYPRLVRRRHENDDESSRVLELYFPEGLQPLVAYALQRHFGSRPA